MSTQTRIYLDNAAATAADSRVVAAMEPYWQEKIGNADALHSEGCAARSAVEDARLMVAEAIGAHTDEIILSSGGTEANNMAIIGLLREYVANGVPANTVHMVTTALEHSSVSGCVQALERDGVEITYVPVDAEGFVDVEALASAIRPTTMLVSILYAHNEIGTVQHMHAISRIVRRAREGAGGVYPLLHIDASQAFTWLPCKVATLGVDLMTLDAQKMHGPKGAGCLYKARHVALAPLLYGGGQEQGLRPGTPPTPLVVGFAKAVTLVEAERESYVPKVQALRDHFISSVQAALPDVVVNGPLREGRLPNNINLSFPGLDGEQIVLELDARNIACSTRSACLLGEAPGSHIVRALGKEEDVAMSAVRFSLSRHTTEEEIASAIQALVETVHWLQKD